MDFFFLMQYISKENQQNVGQPVTESVYCAVHASAVVRSGSNILIFCARSVINAPLVRKHPSMEIIYSYSIDCSAIKLSSLKMSENKFFLHI